jgi:hypothetical protein
MDSVFLKAGVGLNQALRLELLESERLDATGFVHGAHLYLGKLVANKQATRHATLQELGLLTADGAFDIPVDVSTEKVFVLTALVGHIIPN